jgi:hypothetical protein
MCSINSDNAHAVTGSAAGFNIAAGDGKRSA